MNNTLLLEKGKLWNFLLTGPHEEIAPLQLSFDPLTILLPSKILTWCWSTLGIAGFFFWGSHKTSKQSWTPVSTSCTLCDSWEERWHSAPGGPNGYNTKTLKCHFTDLFNTWTWYKAFGFALSLSFLSGWKKSHLHQWCFFKTPGGFYTL